MSLKNNNLQNANDVIEFLKQNSLPENFCIIPFINMILGPGGDISVCRQKGTEHIVGSLKKNTLQEIWNNSFMQQWREEFLSGRPKICADEVKNVHCHLSPEHYWDTGVEKPEKQMPYPFKKLTANLNGECNIRCVMCKVWKQENGFYTEDNFWTNAKTEIYPFIDEIEMLSGEPLIQEDTFRLFREAVEVHSNIKWSITTNGYWNFEGRIEQELGRLNIKRFIFSIDSLNSENYSKIRVGAELKTVLENVHKVKKFGEQAKNPFNVTIHFLVMKSNYSEVLDFLDYCHKHGYKYILDLCERPNALSLLYLDEEKRVEIARSWLEEGQKRGIHGHKAIVLRLIANLNVEKKKEIIIKLLEARG